MEMLCALLGALLGGSLTIASEYFFRKRDENEAAKHYASILYYDLDSIHKYIVQMERQNEFERNIRFSHEWDKAVSQCVFLGPEMIRKVYRIFDCVCEFNYALGKNDNVKISFDKLNYEMRDDSIKYHNLMTHLATYATAA